jgi:hypothetical protein
MTGKPRQGRHFGFTQNEKELGGTQNVPALSGRFAFSGKVAHECVRLQTLLIIRSWIYDCGMQREA